MQKTSLNDSPFLGLAKRILTPFPSSLMLFQSMAELPVAAHPMSHQLKSLRLIGKFAIPHCPLFKLSISPHGHQLWDRKCEELNI